MCEVICINSFKNEKLRKEKEAKIKWFEKLESVDDFLQFYKEQGSIDDREIALVKEAIGFLTKTHGKIDPQKIREVAEVIDKSSFSLIGCTVAPGFDFEDFEIGEREELISKFPKLKDLIKDFTKDNAQI